MRRSRKLALGDGGREGKLLSPPRTRLSSPPPHKSPFAPAASSSPEGGTSPSGAFSSSPPPGKIPRDEYGYEDVDAFWKWEMERRGMLPNKEANKEANTDGEGSEAEESVVPSFNYGLLSPPRRAPPIPPPSACIVDVDALIKRHYASKKSAPKVDRRRVSDVSALTLPDFGQFQLEAHAAIDEEEEAKVIRSPLSSPEHVEVMELGYSSSSSEEEEEEEQQQQQQAHEEEQHQGNEEQVQVKVQEEEVAPLKSAAAVMGSPSPKLTELRSPMRPSHQSPGRPPPHRSPDHLLRRSPRLSSSSPARSPAASRPSVPSVSAEMATEAVAVAAARSEDALVDSGAERSISPAEAKRAFRTESVPMDEVHNFPSADDDDDMSLASTHVEDTQSEDSSPPQTQNEEMSTEMEMGISGSPNTTGESGGGIPCLLPDTPREYFPVTASVMATVNDGETVNDWTTVHDNMLGSPSPPPSPTPGAISHQQEKREDDDKTVVYENGQEHSSNGSMAAAAKKKVKEERMENARKLVPNEEAVEGAKKMEALETAIAYDKKMAKEEAALQKANKIMAEKAAMEAAISNAKKMAAEEARMADVKKMAAEEAAMEAAIAKAKRMAAEEANIADAKKRAEEESLMEEAVAKAKKMAAEEAAMEDDRIVADNSAWEMALANAEKIAAEETVMAHTRNMSGEEAKSEDTSANANIMEEEAQIVNTAKMGSRETAKGTGMMEIRPSDRSSIWDVALEAADNISATEGTAEIIGEIKENLPTIDGVDLDISHNDSMGGGRSESTLEEDMAEVGFNEEPIPEEPQQELHEGDDAEMNKFQDDAEGEVLEDSSKLTPEKLNYDEEPLTERNDRDQDVVEKNTFNSAKQKKISTVPTPTRTGTSSSSPSSEERSGHDHKKNSSSSSVTSTPAKATPKSSTPTSSLRRSPRKRNRVSFDGSVKSQNIRKEEKKPKKGKSKKDKKGGSKNRPKIDLKKKPRQGKSKRALSHSSGSESESDESRRHSNLHGWKNLPISDFMEDDENAESGPNRRSRRAKCPPLRYWRCERLVYGVDENISTTKFEMPVVKGVVKAPPTPDVR
eukprot:CAMPEP_0113329880 /NCGR_PEP_ID=MMETSP0010_2-20120614/21218_1 /TAXON_ID=216773 ORGANISM="Corethron hystrix, Strain 308" /NCGR_SAMPLE_ID=MMETSP0010_2 /ASSEMBLY_ACC=CAM_ASM_000155 /LENGTH=1077 /DNA_ID=CAMNT_0000192163 /DNA_START=314 /DNA_END=3544 /DNA_ORIENTATION=- /assembly_acc=CAM_ASM_000155